MLNCSIDALAIVGCVSGKLWRDVRNRGGGLDDRDLGPQSS
jgi:hypothetical protein